jgi:hypothetical protein
MFFKLPDSAKSLVIQQWLNGPLQILMMIIRKRINRYSNAKSTGWEIKPIDLLLTVNVVEYPKCSEHLDLHLEPRHHYFY